MLDHALVTYCAPTLARLKVGSLFNLQNTEPFALAAELCAILKEISPKGLAIRILYRGEKHMLVYVYRAQELKTTLAREDVRAFLADCGYADFSVNGVLRTMSRRLEANPGFQHEIGVLLGYPLADVIAFIENGGRNCLCVGDWKVYGDESAARRLFARYRKCREVYGRLFSAGRSLAQLTVATAACGAQPC